MADEGSSIILPQLIILLLLYRYPTNQINAESKELLGHADHVKHVAFMEEAKLVSSGGHEISLLQWSNA